MLHLVLRLRGGGYHIIIKAYGIEINVAPDDIMTLNRLKQAVCNQFPTVDIAKIRLFNKNAELIGNKKVVDYGIDHTNYNVELRYPRIYRT